jgi:hypothetical protein
MSNRVHGLRRTPHRLLSRIVVAYRICWASQAMAILGILPECAHMMTSFSHTRRHNISHDFSTQKADRGQGCENSAKTGHRNRWCKWHTPWTLESTHYYYARRKIDPSGQSSDLKTCCFRAAQGLTPGRERPVDDNQRSRLMALGSLNLTAETSRWVHGCENLAKGVAWCVTRQRAGFWRWRRRQKRAGGACGTTRPENFSPRNC